MQTEFREYILEISVAPIPREELLGGEERFELEVRRKDSEIRE